MKGGMPLYFIINYSHTLKLLPSLSSTAKSRAVIPQNVQTTHNIIGRDQSTTPYGGLELSTMQRFVIERKSVGEKVVGVSKRLVFIL